MSCRAAAVTDVRPPGGLPFVIVGDELRLLQALRIELRPTVAEVDGILGASALVNARVDLDYPNGRVLWRCGESAEQPPSCTNYTAIVDRTRAGALPNPVARCAP